MEKTLSSNLVLAIAPVSRGFGYAVFEALDVLVDWSIKEVRGITGRNAACIRLVGKLLATYRPDVVTIEDWRDERGRRSPRVRELLALIADQAAAAHTPVSLVRRSDIRSVFEGQGARNKHDIARVIVRMFPELGPRLPKRRRTWESERYQMALFEAVALGMAHLALAGGTSLPPAG